MADEKTSTGFGVNRVVIPGITADARILGVERTHLYRVLRGKRQSKKLLSKYQQLKEQQRKANNEINET